MITIFEGPDGGGKTTLAMRLALRMGGFYFHAGTSDRLNEAMRDYHGSILENADTNSRLNGKFVMLDRHWPSEWVYAQIFRPKYFSLSQRLGWFESMYNRCLQLGVLYVYCFDSKAQQRHDESKKPDLYEPDEYEDIVKHYEMWMKTFPATVYKYEAGVTKLPDVELAIQDAAERLP